MNATIFRDFSDASDIVAITPGTPLYKSIQLDYSDKIIIANGKEVSSDYIPKEKDVIIVRTIPGVVSTATLVILGIIAVASLVTAGVAGYMAYQARKQAEELADQMRKSAGNVNNLPFIRGSTNSIATGQTQPYIIGEHLFTPYLLGQPFYAIGGTDGVDQYFVATYECGFNKQVLRELRSDDVVLKDFGYEDTNPQEGIFQFDEDSPFYNASSFFEVAQDGEDFATADFNKVVKTIPGANGAELKKANDAKYEDLIYKLPMYSRSVDVCIAFKGLTAYKSDGDRTNRTVVVRPYYSLNNGESWTQFNFSGVSNNTFTRNTLNEIRYNAHIDFTWGQVSGLDTGILVKLVCTTDKAKRAYDTCVVQWVQTTSYDHDLSVAADEIVNEKPLDAPEAALSTRLAIKIKATQSNQEKLNKINVITSGVARTWNGEGWSESREPTRNLASWIYEVLTSESHKPSQISDEEIDLATFGEYYEYCEENNIRADLVLTDGDEKSVLLDSLCDIGHCVLYKNIYDEISIAWDAVKENAIAVINTQNVISFEVEKQLSRNVDGLRVSYVSRDTEYSQDAYLVMRDGVSRGPDTILRDITARGITEFDAIVAYARRIMAIAKLRPRTVRVSVGKEGVFYVPLGLVNVQHPALSNGLGSTEIKRVITSGANITGVELYDPIPYDAYDPDGFGVVIMSVSDTYSRALAKQYTAAQNGRVKEISFSVPIPNDSATIPHVGDVLSYGYLNAGQFDTITSPMLIIGIDPSDTGQVLTLVDYNESIYDVGTIPEYTPNITKQTPISPGSVIEKPVEVVPTEQLDDIYEELGYRPTSTELAAAPPALSALTAVAHRDGVRLTPTLPAATDPSQGATGLILQRSRDNGTTWTDILGATDGTAKVAPGSYDWLFARATDGYPEASGSAQPWAPLSAYRFRAKAVNAAGTASADWTYSGAPDVAGYGTWLGGTPTNGRGTSAGRDVKAQVDRPGSTVYGWAGLDVQISKDQATGYEPQTGLDPFVSEDNWRQTATAGAWRRIVDPQFTTSVPLEGQLNGISRATSYYFRFRYVTDRAWSSGSPAGYVDSSGLTAGPWSSWIPVVATQVKEDDIRDTLSNIYASIPGLMAAYSGRSLPDMPNDPAGVTYRQNAWATVDGWTGPNIVLSTDLGYLFARRASTTGQIVFSKTVSFSGNKTYRLKIKCDRSDVLRLRATADGVSTILADMSFVAGVERVVDVYIPTATSVTLVTIATIGVLWTTTEYISIDWIYIGTGAYLPGSLRDLTGNGYGMTAYGVTPNGDALVFDGVDDYTETLEAHTMPDLFWIHFKASGLAQGSAIQEFLDWTNSTFNAGGLLIRRPANSDDLQILTATGAATTVSNVSSFFTSSAVEFSVAVDVLNGKLLITRNGLRVQEFTGLTIAKPTATIIFGRRRDTTSQNLKGSLSELRLINAYTTAAQVLELYQNPASGMPLVIGAERIFGELATIVEGDISVITGGTRDPWNMWVLADYRNRPVDRPVGLQRAGDEFVFTRVLPTAAGTLADPKIWHEANGDYIKFLDTGIAIKASLLELDALSSKLYSSLEIHKSKAEPGVPLKLSANGVRYGYIGIGSLPTYLQLDQDSPSLTIAGFSSTPAVLNLGLGRTGNASSLIDFFTASGGAVGMRIIRGSGANADNELLTFGTGVLRLRTGDAGPIVMDTTGTERMRISAAGLVSIGTTDAAGETLRVAGTGRLDRLGIGGASEAADIMRVYGGARANRLGVGGATETVHATALTGGTLVKDRLMILTDLDDPALQVFPAGRFSVTSKLYSQKMYYITHLEGQDIAAIYKNGNEKWLVRLQIGAGSSLTLVGSALQILNTSTEDVYDLKSQGTGVVVVLTKTTGDVLTLRRYAYSGGTWSATGTNLTVSSVIASGALTNVSAGSQINVVFPVSSLLSHRMRRYLVTTSFSLTGNEFTFPVGLASPAIAEMSADTDVAVIDSGTKTLRMMRFSSPNWSQVGELYLGSSTMGNPRLKHIGSNVVALLDSTSKQVRLFRWWRDAWAQISEPQAFGLDVAVDDLASSGSRSLLVSDADYATGYNLRVCTSRNGISFD